jgi:hypothetical protein
LLAPVSFYVHYSPNMLEMKKIIFVVLLFLSFFSFSQKMVLPDTMAIHSISGIVNEVLRLTSNKKGESRNFDALRNLFLPTARFTVVNHGDSFPQPVESVSLEEFISLLRDDEHEQGYREYEISHTVNEFNGIAQVFQPFRGVDAEQHAEKGVNSYQLAFYKNRWWIVSVLWTLESKGFRVNKNARKT